MKIEKDRVLQLFEDSSIGEPGLSLFGWLKLMTWEDSTIASDVIGQVKHMANSVRYNPASIEAHLTQCYAATSVSKGLLMLEVKTKGSRARTIGNIALQTEAVRDEIHGDRITAAGTLAFTDLFLQIFNSDSIHAVRNVGLDFDGLCAWLTIYTGDVVKGRVLFDQVLDVVMNNDLDLTAIRFRRGNARRRANSARSGIIKLDMYAERSAQEPLGTFSFWTKPTEYGAREYLDPDRFTFVATNELLQAAITLTTQEPAQEAAVSTTITPTVKYIEVKQGVRMPATKFANWLLEANGEPPTVTPEVLTKFVDDMGELNVSSSDLAFSVRRVIPHASVDVFDRSRGLLDVVLMIKSVNRKIGWRILRFFSIQTIFQLHGENELQESVLEIIVPHTRGLRLMSLPSQNYKLMLGELGNFLMGADSSEAAAAEDTIARIKTTFLMLRPNATAADASSLWITLERVRTAEISNTHRLTEGVMVGTVFSHFETELLFTFELITDVVTDPRTGGMMEMVHQFRCQKLEELTAEAGRAASKDKLRMSDASEFMAKPATSPDALGGLFKASQSQLSKPLEITGQAPIISVNKNAGTIFTTDAFAFLNHAMGALGSLLTDEEQLKAQVFIRFIDQMYPLKGVSGETFEVEFEEHDRLHITALEGHDEVARLHLKLK
jgi:hypothetical protein